MEEVNCTIFATWNDGSERQGRRCFFPHFDKEPTKLEERIEYVRNYKGEDSFIPIAWQSDRTSIINYINQIDESIAAGRVIDFVDGKYIPRGVEPEPICFERVEPIEGPFLIGAEEQRSLARLSRLRTLEVADRNCAMRPSDEIPPAPLPVEKVGGFDAFPGFVVDSGRAIDDPGYTTHKPAGLTRSPDIGSTSHQVHYEHGSAVWAGEKRKV